MLDACESRDVEERFIVNVGSPVSGRSGVLNNIATGDAIDRVLEVNVTGKDGGVIHEFECSVYRPNRCSCVSTGEFESAKQDEKLR